MSSSFPNPSGSDPLFGVPASSIEAEVRGRKIRAVLFGGTVEPVHLGRFRVLGTLGVGGMGIVYAAHDDVLDRVVALKIIRDDRLASRNDRARLLREARSLAKLSHPNVVQLHEVVDTPEAMFLVMEHVVGMTLREWLDDRTLTMAEIVAIFLAVARGLEAAHAAGIFHRDIKPSNIIIGADGRPRIVDFGLARGAPSATVLAPDEGRSTAEMSTPRSGGTTQTGVIAGTPAYMAPEALAGTIDARGDQFSFCVTFYEAIYGQRPLAPEVPGLAVERQTPHLRATSGSLRVPRSVRRVLARGLAPTPSQRFADMGEVIAVLASRPLGLAWVSGLVSALGLGILFSGPWNSATPRLCPDDAVPLAGVWDEATRAGLRDSLAASGKDAAGMGGRVVTRLDKYFTAWSAARRKLCIETEGREAPTLAAFPQRMDCLEESKQTAQALVQLLVNVDTGVVAVADEIVQALPDPARCFDGSQARASGLSGATSDGIERRAKLATAVALQQVRHTKEALDLAEQVRTASVAAGDRRSEAAALEFIGRVRAHSLGDVEGGIAALETAVDRAVDDAESWRIWRAFASIHAELLQDATEATRHLSHAREALVRYGVSETDEASLLDVEAKILWLKADTAAALDRCERALALRKSVLPAGHPELAWSRLAVANALADCGRMDEASEHYAALIEDLRRDHGAKHPVVALVEIAQGQHLAQLGRHAEARAQLERVRPIVLEVYGKKAPQLAVLDVELVRLDMEAGALEVATSRAEATLASIEAGLPNHYSLRVETLALLAELYLRRENLVDLLQVSRSLLALHDEHGQELELDALLYNIGDLLCLLNRCGEALGPFMRLLKLQEERPPTEPIRAVLPLYGLGRLHLDAGNEDLALIYLTRAEQLHRAYPTEAPEWAIDTYRLLARCLRALAREPTRQHELLAEAAALARELKRRPDDG